MAPSQALASRLAQAGHYPYNNYSQHQGQFYFNQFSNPPQQNFTSSAHQYQTPQANVPNTQAFTVYNQVSSTSSRSSSSPSYHHNAAGPVVTAAAGQDKSRSVSSDRHRTEKLKDSPAPASPGPSNGELKPSRSVGDMISELQREAEELQQLKKKSPSSRPTSRGATGLENWTPWPQLDSDTVTNGGPGPGHVTRDETCLECLKSDEKQLCRQLHEMGFPLTRLAKGVTAVGPNSQKLINFCLVVDR